MPDEMTRFEMPPQTTAESGEVRRVGFELEFSGVTLEQAGQAVQSAAGGELKPESVAELTLDADLGRFNIEVDWDFLKRTAADAGGEGGDDRWLELLSRTAALVVPLEVVCPPVPLDRLEELHPLVEALRDAGATGTEESLIAAYGVHINAEIPRLNAPTLAAYLRAFALLQWWLLEAHEVDPARRISPYIDLFPEAYIRQLLARVEPTMDQLFSDYLEHNASRNRALDLLPLLAHIDEERVRRAIDDPRIKPRPAFHYRLPNCQIEKAGWSLALSWNIWCVVERLANQPAELEQLGDAFLEQADGLLGINRFRWTGFVSEWLRDRELV
ncbi:amidoligase family protein [Microbulbifer yueqingensis]|uniref:Putative amidoligase enzyme n=1 Tax=Microbulbifer yueqingensis TaxID=658219 RepID=A0A1G9CYH7_9GAMM|nr:amidoligase family protein [Microbulbifer yueqingensis]SDK56455.1 Putative amidoligase enzyme [Microbulbifer yueqingensis]